MRKLFVIYFLAPFSVFAQLSESFGDGDFVNNPVWNGDTAKFTVNASKQLQLNAPAIDDSAYLSTANVLSNLNNTEWQIWVKMVFAPSDNNMVRIYLTADQLNLYGAINGYFIGAGENGSDDSIDLFKQTGNNIQKIIDGINGHIAKNSNTIKVKVKRDTLGNWSLFADTLGNNDFLLEGSVLDTTFNSSNYFGVKCYYTSTRSTSFYFDDIYCGPFIVDTVPPKTDSVYVVSSNKITLKFNEDIEETSAETITNYFVNNSIGSPLSSNRDSTDFTKVHLQFTNTFTDSTLYQITINNLKDNTGNIIVNATKDFLYLQPLIPVYKDIVINEIFPDPTPQVALPEYEFIELYNSSNKTVTLNGWTLSDTSTTQTIPTITLGPNAYIILCSNSAAAFYQNYGTVVGMSSVPSLNNDGDNLYLKDENGTLIDKVFYKIGWYQSASKQDGGWTLELINPYLECSNDSNWKASINSDGGTPGTINSIYSNAPDTDAPKFAKVIAKDDSTIHVFFNEPIDSSKGSNNSNYVIDNGIGNPVSAIQDTSDFSLFILNISKKLVRSQVYTLTVNNISDCEGNIINSNTRFALSDTIDSLEIIINEVLFNPKSGGVDFVEIYNRSNKVFNLQELRLANINDDTIASIKTITENDYLIFPNEYIVLTTNSDIVKLYYYVPNPDKFIKLTSLPTYSDDEGTVVLTKDNKFVVDKFHYDENMHFALLDDAEGVSLERLNSERSTQDSTNWHSASSTVGYATPTYENSQQTSTVFSENAITVEPEVFTPDNDGVNDVVNINYKFDEPGYVATISVFNARGMLATQLANNELLGNKGTYSWNGISNKGEKALIGIYIIYFEVFNLKGEIQKYKVTCVLGSRL